MKKIIAIVATLLATLIMTGCGAAKLTPAQQALVDSKATMYTQVAMWTEKNRIIGTNYSVGTFIPPNSEVKVIDVSSKVIVFEYNGQKIKYEVYTKYTRVDASSMLDRLFGTSKVDLSKYDEKTQANIMHGTVAVGMTKEAVLAARGYPPFHVTASTQENSWKYWRNRWTTGMVTFENNVVIKSSVL